jgi:hypothetical protein
MVIRTRAIGLLLIGLIAACGSTGSGRMMPGGGTGGEEETPDAASGGRGGRPAPSGGSGGTAPGGAGGATGGQGGGGSGGTAPDAGGGEDAPGGSGSPDATAPPRDLRPPDVGAGPYSAWVYPGADGRLVYKKDARGNQVPDFSNAGYRGGGVALPFVPVKETLSPMAAGDDGARIQAALDAVGALPLDGSGFRGALLLKKGTYRIAGVITINKSGVVLRGEGQGADGTVLVATGAVQRSLVQVKGAGGLMEVAGTRRPISDDYVPVGAHTFHVDDASGFKVGDTVVVHRPTTQEWIDLLGMDACGAVGTKYDTADVNGSTCLENPWTPGSKDLSFDRVITAIAGNAITVDAPIVDALDKEFGGGSVYKYTAPGRISEVGVENLRGDSEYVGPEDEMHGWNFIHFMQVVNGWVRDITGIHYGYAAVNINSSSKWVTVQDSSCLDPISMITGGRRYSFNVDNSQMVLFQRLVTREGRHDYVEGSNVPGPNVFLDSKASNSHADIGPHHRWSAGGLYDSLVSNREINVRNRGNSGTGHGWAGGNMVIWNSTASSMLIQNPPGSQNWAIGCTATRTGDGIFDSHGTKVWPPSLYLEQLMDRLGPAAVAAISR